MIIIVSDVPLTDSETATIQVTNVSLQVMINIDAATVNLDRKAQWVTAYIEPHAGYELTQIVPSTVKLQDIRAVTDPKYDFVTNPRVYITDEGKDKVLGRMVKFDWNTLRIHLTTGDNRLTLSGTLSGWPGVPDFTGNDTVKVKVGFLRCVLYYLRHIVRGEPS